MKLVKITKRSGRKRKNMEDRKFLSENFDKKID